MPQCPNSVPLRLALSRSTGACKRPTRVAPWSVSAPIIRKGGERTVDRSPLRCRRAKHRIAIFHALPICPAVERHARHRPSALKRGSRRAKQLEAKRAPVNRLLIGEACCGDHVGFKMLRREPRGPDREKRQFRKSAREFEFHRNSRQINDDTPLTKNRRE